MSDTNQQGGVPGRGTNPEAGGTKGPIDPTQPGGAEAARQAAETQRQDNEVLRQQNEQKRQDADAKRQKDEAQAKAKAAEQRKIRRDYRTEQDSAGKWTEGPVEFFDNLWGSWFYKGQPVKVSKVTYSMGSSFQSGWGASTTNLIGVKNDVLIEPIPFFLKNVKGGGLLALKGYRGYRRRWPSAQNKDSAPIIPPGVSAIGSLVGANLTPIANLVAGQGSRTQVTVGDQTLLNYLGEYGSIRRHVDVIDYQLGYNTVAHKVCMVVMWLGAVSLMAITVAVRLAWYDFDTGIANASEGRFNDLDDPTPANTPLLQEEWEGRWKSGKLFAKTVVPEVEERWLALLIALEGFMERKLSYLKAKVAYYKADLKKKEYWVKKVSQQLLELGMQPGVSDERLAEAREEIQRVVSSMQATEAKLRASEANVTEFMNDLRMPA